MNILEWIRQKAKNLMITPLDDPSGYQLEYGEGVISVSWEVGDESYFLDINMMNFTLTAESYHERYPGVPVRTVNRPFTLSFLD